MKIGVCIKHVPANDGPLRFDADTKWIREDDTSFDINEADNYALEEALRIKEKQGGEVVVVTLGPERAAKAVREALAKGADRGILVADDDYHQLDPLQLSASLAAVLGDEGFDLVLTGLQSDDHGFAQTGVMLAEILNYPHASIVVEIAVSDHTLIAKRELESGWYQDVELPLPCLLTVQSGINKPRYAGMKGMMAAKKKQIKRIDRAGLALTMPAPTIRVDKLYVPIKTKQLEILEGDSSDIAAGLISKLKLNARV